MFADEYERKAHDIICIVKHGSIGGQASTQEVKRVAAYLRGDTAQRRPGSNPPPPLLVKPQPPRNPPPVFKLPT